MSQLYSLYVADEAEARGIWEQASDRYSEIAVPAFDQAKQLSLLWIFPELAANMQVEQRLPETAPATVISSSEVDDYLRDKGIAQVGSSAEIDKINEYVRSKAKELEERSGEPSLLTDITVQGVLSKYHDSLSMDEARLASIDENYHKYFKLLYPAQIGSERFVAKFHDDLVEALAELSDDSVFTIADKWAVAEPSFVECKWSKLDVQCLLEKIVATCRAARKSNKNVLFKFSL